ncbi:MAG: hypothetical protein JW957_04915 [Candidatus Omnitrophica bacterium]|nr:hypothetical protein [Candidatus Omnitrophota bacterium]
MKESALGYILKGLFAGLSVYAFIGWIFTRKTAASGGYIVKFLIFLAVLAVLIVLA